MAAFRGLDDDIDKGWIGLGRWGTWIFELFLLRPLNPYFSMLFGGIFLAISFLFFAQAVRIRITPYLIFSFILFAGFPTWYYIIEFKGTFLANSVAVFLAALASVSYNKTSFSRPLFVLLLVPAIAIYQSTLLVALTIVFASLIVEKHREPNYSILFPLSLAALLSILSVIIYFLIWKFLMVWFGIKMSYINHFIDLDSLLRNPIQIMGRTVREGLSVYLGASPIFIGSKWFSGILFILGLIAFTLQFSDWRKPKQVVFSALIPLIILLGLPFSFNLLSGGTLPYRTLLAVPFAYWFLIITALQSGYRWIRLAATGLMLIVAVQYFQIASLSYFSHHFTAIHDQLIAAQVYQRISEKVPDFNREMTYPVEFVGALAFPNEARYPTSIAYSHSQVMGVTTRSVFEWDPADPIRVIYFMKLLGFGNFRFIYDAERATIIHSVDDMPSWPNRDAVRIINGIVVVKFGNYPPGIRQSAINFMSSKPPGN